MLTHDLYKLKVDVKISYKISNLDSIFISITRYLSLSLPLLLPLSPSISLLSMHFIFLPHKFFNIF